MEAFNLITQALPYIKPEDTGERALELMAEFKVIHLPLVEHSHYITLVAEDYIYNYELEKIKFKDANLEIIRPYIFEKQNIFDILNLLNNIKLSVLPVLAKDQLYLGSVLVSDLIFKLIDYFGLAQEGAVLILRVKNIDYSITLIGNIIEANNAKILSLFTLTENDTFKKIIIKVNTTDVISLLETFERYDYEVDTILFDDEKYKDIYQERWEALMKYLDT